VSREPKPRGKIRRRRQRGGECSSGARAAKVKDLIRRGRFCGRVSASRDVLMANSAQAPRIDRSEILGLAERVECGGVSQEDGPLLARRPLHALVRLLCHCCSDKILPIPFTNSRTLLLTFLRLSPQLSNFHHEPIRAHTASFTASVTISPSGSRQSSLMISSGDSGLCLRMTDPLIAAVPCGETSHCRRIFSIIFPFASSSISLSK
jgi:hypothetical protein